MEDISCYCGNKVSYNLDEVVLYSNYTTLLGNLNNGKFQSVKCSKCENDLNIEVLQKLNFEDEKNTILFIPETKRSSFYKNEIKTKKIDIVAIGIKELKELLLILNKNIDKRIIEYIKYQFLRKASKEDLNIIVKSISDTEISFYVYGYTEDKVGLTKINMNFYNKLSNEINDFANKSPYLEIFKPPYISINKIYRKK